MDHLIHHPLAYVRIERGWTQPDLAREIRQAALRRGLRSGIEKQRIWKWENYRAVPDADSQMLLADVFEVDQSLVTALGWPDWLPGRDGVIPLAPHHTATALREALKALMDRRTFLAYSTAALAGLAHQWAVTEPQAIAGVLDGKPIDIELLEMLEAHSHRLTSLITTQRQYTQALLDTHLSTVTELIEKHTYTEPIAGRLHTLAARLSSTAGWYRFDQGKHAAAGRYWHGALHSAHASGDRDLGSGILSDLAYQATWLNQPRTASQILEHAVSRTRHPTARSLLHLRLARAHAALGEARACRRALSTSELELANAGEDPPPTWCSWMSPADLLVDSGKCLLHLGHTERAHQLIDEGMTLLPNARAKTQAVFLTYAADGYLQAGEVDNAAAAAKKSLTLANTMGAPRCVTLVHELLPRFKKHPTAEGVDELLELADRR